MKNLYSWVMNHKLVVVLLAVVGYLLLGRESSPYPIGRGMMGSIASYGEAVSDSYAAAPMMARSGKMAILPPDGGEPAPVQSADRMVVKDTNLSLQVKNVNTAVAEIDKIATNNGGYMVDSNVSVPEGAASGTITIRIPTEKRADVLGALRGLAVKVVSESVNGRDVTDQYQDLEERLRQLRVTKAKFEDIQRSAVKVQDILEVTRELSNIQSQIDSIVGQQKYLEQTAKLTKVSVYLSTDEFALPYTPDQPWRPEVVFKEAVRSLVSTFNDAGSKAIWFVVFAPIWVPVLVVAWFVKRKYGTKSETVTVTKKVTN